MTHPLNVLFLSSEVFPFAKTGGLADVASALPQALKEIGNDVRLAIPRYGFVNERKFRIDEIIRLKNIDIPIGKKTAKLNVKSSFLVGERIKVHFYFIDSPDFFDRAGIYQDPKLKKIIRITTRDLFFIPGVSSHLETPWWTPDIIHCNDWQSGLVPVYLKKIYAKDPFFRKTKSVFTIHNVAYQGNFPTETFRKTGLPEDVFTPEGGRILREVQFHEGRYCLFRLRDDGERHLQQRNIGQRRIRLRNGGNSEQEKKSFRESSTVSTIQSDPILISTSLSSTLLRLSTQKSRTRNTC